MVQREYWLQQRARVDSDLIVLFCFLVSGVLAICTDEDTNSQVVRVMGKKNDEVKHRIHFENKYVYRVLAFTNKETEAVCALS